MENIPDPVMLVDLSRPGPPGSLTLTAIDAAGEDIARIDAFATSIVGALVEQPGYLGTLFAATAGSRHFTVSAWESVEAVEALRETTHAEAVRAFLSPPG